MPKLVLVSFKVEIPDFIEWSDALLKRLQSHVADFYTQVSQEQARRKAAKK